MTSITGPTFSNQIANSTATCNPGDVVLSGGYRLFPFPFPNSGFLDLITVETEPTSTKDGWTTEIQTPSFRTFSLVSIAECFDNP